MGGRRGGQRLWGCQSTWAWPGWRFTLGWMSSQRRCEAPKAAGSTRGGSGKVLSEGCRSHGTWEDARGHPTPAAFCPLVGRCCLAQAARRGVACRGVKMTRNSAGQIQGIHGMGTLGDRDPLGPGSSVTGMLSDLNPQGRGSLGTGILRD